MRVCIMNQSTAAEHAYTVPEQQQPSTDSETSCCVPSKFFAFVILIIAFMILAIIAVVYSSNLEVDAVCGNKLIIAVGLHFAIPFVEFVILRWAVDLGCYCSATDRYELMALAGGIAQHVALGGFLVLELGIAHGSSECTTALAHNGMGVAILLYTGWLWFAIDFLSVLGLAYMFVQLWYVSANIMNSE